MRLKDDLKRNTFLHSLEILPDDDDECVFHDFYESTLDQYLKSLQRLSDEEIIQTRIKLGSSKLNLTF